LKNGEISVQQINGNLDNPMDIENEIKEPLLDKEKIGTFITSIAKSVENIEISRSESFFENSKKGYADIESKGKRYRYKIGIIDFLTEYDSTKYIENQVKSKLANVDSYSISAIDPKSYQRRFVEFMKE